MLNRKLLLLPLLLFFFFLFFSCSEKKSNLTDAEIKWLKEKDSLTVALFPYYPPYQFINEDNDIVGVFVEYINLIEKKIDYKFKRKYYLAWPAMMNDIRNGKIDIGLEIQATQNRNSYLNFYAETFESEQVIVTRKGDDHNTKISDYKNKIITVPEEYAVYENLKRKYPNQTFVGDKNDLTCLQKLNSGAYDAYIGPKAVVNYIIKTKNLNQLTIAGKTDLIYKPGISVYKENTILNDILKKAFSNISEIEKNELVENWLFEESKPFYKKTNFIVPVALIIVLSLTIILSINFYLGFLVRRKTKELKQAKDIAEKDEQLKTAFIRNVSEEIRTPINGIINFSKLLNEPKLTLPKKKKYAKIIKGSCEQLIDSIDNILEISQLQTQQINLNKEETDLYEVFETVYALFDIKAKKKNVSLILNNNINKNNRYVVIDKSKLLKIINGVLENSINHTKKGAILVSCTTQDFDLIITVRDSGIGINTSDAKSILKSISKSENQISKKYGGIGLGLIVSKENTALMGGKLSFSSIPKKGSTFRIELPYQQVDAKIKHSSTNKKNQNIKRKRYETLIAEDGEVNFLFLKTILLRIDRYEFVIHRAKTGKEAVDFYAKNRHIDIIFMDIKMPEMNGYDASRIIKKINANIPIIAQTAYSTKEDIENTLQAGCDDFISKPINPKTLKTILKKHL